MTHHSSIVAQDALMLRVQQDGCSVFLDRRPVRRGEAFRSQMAGGLWLGAVVSAELQTDEPVFGRRQWHGPSASGFWAPEPMPSDHLVLADSEMASFFVHLDDSAMGRMGLGRQSLAGWSGHRLGTDDPLLDHMLRDVRALLAAPDAGGRNGLLAAGRSMVTEFFGHAGLLPDELSDRDLPAPDLQRILLARDLLLADLSNPPSIVELARHSGTNARKLTEQFRLLFGLPPFAYLKRYRLEHALDALRHGDRPIASIAAEIGYRPAHLSAAFRARFGRSPRDYRAGESTAM